MPQLGQHIADTDELVITQPNGKQIILSGSIPRQIVIYKPSRYFVGKEFDEDTSKKTIKELLPPLFADYIALGRMNYITEGLLILRSPDFNYSSATKTSDQFKQVYLLGVDEEISEQIQQELVQKLGFTELAKLPESAHSDYEYLKLSSELHWYTIVKGQTRPTLFNLLAENSIIPERLIKVQDGEVVLSHTIHEELTKKGFMSIVVPKD
jgi:16S rRNA U516 pseudouridylate synthase RsuA-like enzyme